MTHTHIKYSTSLTYTTRAVRDRKEFQLDIKYRAICRDASVESHSKDEIRLITPDTLRLPYVAITFKSISRVATTSQKIFLSSHNTDMNWGIANYRTHYRLNDTCVGKMCVAISDTNDNEFRHRVIGHRTPIRRYMIMISGNSLMDVLTPIRSLYDCNFL